MDRQMKGILGWAVVSILVGVVALPVMVAREVWQYATGRASRVEWEDIIGYSVVIGMGAVAHWCWCDLCGMEWWWML